jgi:hypothetical protein
MKKAYLQMAAVVGTLAMGVQHASAIPTSNLGGLQAQLDGMTTDPVGNSSVNVTTDFLADGTDAYWGVNASGGSVSTVMIELAGFSQNTFGIYDRVNPNNKVELFNAASGVGAQALLSIMADGSVRVNFNDTGVDFSGNNFGFYLNVPEANSVWYSDTLLNSDGADHMAAYRGVGDTVEIPPFSAGVWGENEYALAWEDLPATGTDNNFTDLVVLVESVSPVPDGGSTAALLGLGIAGMAWVRRKR